MKPTPDLSQELDPLEYLEIQLWQSLSFNASNLALMYRAMQSDPALAVYAVGMVTKTERIMRDAHADMLEVINRISPPDDRLESGTMSLSLEQLTRDLSDQIDAAVRLPEEQRATLLDPTDGSPDAEAERHEG